MQLGNLGKFNNGPAHENSNHIIHVPTFCQQKQTNPMEIVESFYKQLNSYFIDIASFYKAF